MKIFLGLIFSATILIPFAIAQSAPYQVTIWLKPGQGNVHAEHLCNGAIVHESVIVTTASCLQFTMPGSVISHPVIPSMISVVAGGLTYIYAKIIRGVTNIMIAPGFNPVTQENDVALLILNDSLPLATHPYVQWIILGDSDRVNQSCIANFNNSSSYVYTTGSAQSIFIMDNRFCSNSTNRMGYRRQDICSSYGLNPGVMCNITEDSLKRINDRGTPLVCDSKLFGLLSMVIAPDSKYNVSCSQQRKLNAYYSRVAPHLGWIYDVIARESTKSSPKANHTIAPPFVGKTPAATGSVPTNVKKTNGALAASIPQYLEAVLFAALCFVNICYSI